MAGGTGMVGVPLTKKLKQLGAKIFIASLDDISKEQKKIIKKFYKVDLINVQNCIKVTKNKDYVINLLGVTGSPKINYTNPGSFVLLIFYTQVKKIK